MRPASSIMSKPMRSPASRTAPWCSGSTSCGKRHTRLSPRSPPAKRLRQTRSARCSKRQRSGFPSCLSNSRIRHRHLPSRNGRIRMPSLPSWPCFRSTRSFPCHGIGFDLAPGVVGSLSMRRAVGNAAGAACKRVETAKRYPGIGSAVTFDGVRRCRDWVCGHSFSRVYTPRVASVSCCPGRVK